MGCGAHSLTVRPHHLRKRQNKTAGKAGGGVVGKVWEHKGKKINPYACLDASVRPVTLNSSSVKSKMSHLSSVHPELRTFNCMARTYRSEAAAGMGARFSRSRRAR